MPAIATEGPPQGHLPIVEFVGAVVGLAVVAFARRDIT
jgi:hypothetical protein